MSVIPFTLTLSLCLVFVFVLFFLREQTRRRFSSTESESLLPLADETQNIGTLTARPHEVPGVRLSDDPCSGPAGTGQTAAVPVTPA